MNTNATFEELGYVIVPSLIRSPSELDSLRKSAARVTELTRSGKWQSRRTVGRQFPPFDESNPDSWGVQHIMHPELGEDARSFANWYTSDALLGVVTELMKCREDEVQMELFNMLINPESHDFALRWHRDDVRETALAEEELEALAKWHHGIQWNTALYEDGCLFVVPGSHKVPRTDGQRALSSTQAPPEAPLDMPGAIRVVLQPGETVFYNSNILHCGAYSKESIRATLHGCMGCTRGGSTRARNILQHGLAWMESTEFRDTLSERGKAMLDRLLSMKRAEGNEEIGFSQEN